jgi:hypothetical protein
MSASHGASGPYELHAERFNRLARNMADLLTELIDEANELLSRSEARRKKVFVDMKALLDDVPAPDQGIVLTRLEHEVQRVLDEKGSPKVTASSGPDACVGRPGARVDANINGTTVGACAMVSGGNVIGGGVQVSTSY